MGEKNTHWWWREVGRKAHECQKTWGMGFPVISLPILGPMWTQALATARAEEKEKWQDALFPSLAKWLRRDIDPEGAKLIVDEGQELASSEAALAMKERCAALMPLNKRQFDSSSKLRAYAKGWSDLQAAIRSLGDDEDGPCINCDHQSSDECPSCDRPGCGSPRDPKRRTHTEGDDEGRG